MLKTKSHRRRRTYFSMEAGCPAPVSAQAQYRVQFSDVDPMAVMWHGRYVRMFEQASAELGRRIGLSYETLYHAGLRAPIVQLHVDYFAPLRLSEVITITARLVWNEGARLNTEYAIHRPDGVLAATGYTVQMFVDDGLEPLIASPALLVECRRKWAAGKFS